MTCKDAINSDTTSEEKKVYLWCDNCQDHNLNFLKKNNEKYFLKSECLVCGQKVKDTYQEIADELGDIEIID
jgi:uncharacterized Zn finger protein